MKDAFFGFDYKKQSFIYMVFLIASLNLGMGVWSIIDGSLWDKGAITFNDGGSNLIIGIGFFIVFATLMVKRFESKSQGE